MRNSILKLALILTVTSGFAQQLPFSSQYYTNPFTINPAFTGNHEHVNAFLTHRSQWIGIAGAPQTSFLTVDGPISERNIGLGLKLYSDVTDITSRVGAFADYSYRLKINDDMNVVFGVALGVIDNKIDFSKVVVSQPEDPMLFTTVQHKTVFSADFGVAYNWKKLEVGICVPQLIGNKIRYKKDDGQNSYYKMARQYGGSVKYVFDVIKDKEITAYPLVTVAYTPGSIIQYDVNAVIDWKKIGWFGITYHSDYAVALSAGVRYKGLAVGYAYDLGITSVKSHLGSSSELLLSYTFGGTKKEEAVVTASPNDAVVDEAIAKLKAKADSNQVELDRLKALIEKLGAGGTAATTPGTSESLTENLMRTASSNDFVDENGMSMSGGFYVIVGTFSSKENANKFKDANIIKGYRETQVIQNHKTKVYYVFVHKGDKQEDSEMEQKKFKNEYPDVWIQKLE